MARPMTVAAAAALAEGDVRPVLLFEGVFSEGALRLATGPEDVAFGGETFTANGVFVGISPPEESASVEAAGWGVVLSGIPSAQVSNALQAARRGKTGKVWLGFRDAAGALIEDPFALAEGRLDVPSIADDGETSTITIGYEGHLRDMTRPHEVRYTHEEQQRLFPGDLGFEYVTSVVDKQITWGRG
ncbi:hypothetical protein P6F26_16860 [Roseibacterium sp. SDUM158017]|uniref:hypothetical protein n=1 Tax=Roseicyclus salinarum TaxID=3036773 RepID=UPI0024150E6B|nr:hypothetical protein [Roseibacterium sp. SDUM158017]MDG4650121.1 hypothetical protein [Roseibacterium sp. SDUM158017]